MLRRIFSYVIIFPVVLETEVKMEIKTTSSGSIKTFAKIIFVIGVVFTVIFAIVMVAASISKGTQMNQPIITVGGIVGSVIFCVVTIFLLIVEKAFLMSYAEIAEDMRDVRNILCKRDSKA